ncbi:HmuY family protein [Membranihabitans maritimus]|uniref:HmuY family protein n=1 Tax=Membranihabitans maritimus TaxID=2904244 RepID=UPI001F2E7105|nr:HmuY family protein [Membranihabitans maritimus]
MNTNIYTLFLLLCTWPVFSQEIEQIDQGTNYTQTVYYDLASGEKTAVDYTQWDIAFSVANRSVGVLINESVSGADDATAVSLYSIDTLDFAGADTTMISDTLFNSSVSWGQGAFNEAADTSDVFDFGWGLYSPSNHILTGNRVFIVKLRSGVYKKLLINEYSNSQYKFTYADLDGENEVIDSVASSDYMGKTLAYYSLEDQAALDVEPEEWDLQFTRYVTPLVAGPGIILQYSVTGVLINAGVEVAEAQGVDPETVSFDSYADSLSTDLETIGYDWKSYDFNAGAYSVPEDLVYFVKTANDSIWKIQFLDFDNTTGTSTFEKTFIEVLANNALVPSFVKSTNLFPNPIRGGQLTLEFDSKRTIHNATVSIYNSVGQNLSNQVVQIRQGPNRITTEVNSGSGMHYLMVRMGESVLTKPFVVK